MPAVKNSASSIHALYILHYMGVDNSKYKKTENMKWKRMFSNELTVYSFSVDTLSSPCSYALPHVIT
jgi:hypothetical protein